MAQLQTLPRLELGTFDVILATKIVENICDILRLEVQSSAKKIKLYKYLEVLVNTKIGQ